MLNYGRTQEGCEARGHFQRRSEGYVGHFKTRPGHEHGSEHNVHYWLQGSSMGDILRDVFLYEVMGSSGPSYSHSTACCDSFL